MDEEKFTRLSNEIDKIFDKEDVDSVEQLEFTKILYESSKRAFQIIHMDNSVSDETKEKAKDILERIENINFNDVKGRESIEKMKELEEKNVNNDDSS